MPLTLNKQVLIDTTNRAVVKVTGIASAGDESQTLIDVSTLAGALNATGHVSNTNPLTFYGTTISRIAGVVNTDGSIQIQWAGNTSNSDILIVGGSMSFDFPKDQAGQGVNIPNPGQGEPAVSGDIVVNTVGVSANDSITLIIDLKKDNRFFDAGQTRDPAAFNKDPWAINGSLV